MKWIRPAVVALGLALVALPVAASIKAMDMYEFMGITVETMHGKIVAKDTFKSDYPEQGTVYTRITIEGDTWRSNKSDHSTEMVYMGSHDPADHFRMSEMPEFRDVRLGTEVVVFHGHDERIHPAEGVANVAWNLSAVYRVERGYGEPVVIGKGEGFAFVENMKLSEARVKVRATHELIEVERAVEQAAADK